MIINCTTMRRAQRDDHIATPPNPRNGGVAPWWLEAHEYVSKDGHASMVDLTITSPGKIAQVKWVAKGSSSATFTHHVASRRVPGGYGKPRASSTTSAVSATPMSKVHADVALALVVDSRRMGYGPIAPRVAHVAPSSSGAKVCRFACGLVARIDPTHRGEPVAYHYDQRADPGIVKENKGRYGDLWPHL